MDVLAIYENYIILHLLQSMISLFIILFLIMKARICILLLLLLHGVIAMKKKQNEIPRPHSSQELEKKETQELKSIYPYLKQNQDLWMCDSKVGKEIKAIQKENQWKYHILIRSLFVDKSLFIKTFLTLTIDCLLILRPRRWGKSSILQMIQCFCNAEIDESGDMIADNANKVLFSGGTYKISQEKFIQLPALKISKQKQHEQNFVDKYQGTFIVIHVSFAQFKIKSEDQFFENLVMFNSNLYKKFEFLLKKIQKESWKYKKFNQYLSKEMSTFQMQRGIQFLGELLFDFLKKPSIILLVDQYDTPVNSMLSNSKAKQQQIQSVAQSMTSLIYFCAKQNKYFFSILMTGITNQIYHYEFSTFPYKMFTIRDPNFAEYYGLTQKEIKDEMLSRIFKNDKERSQQIQQAKLKLLSIIKKKYNGYYPRAKEGGVYVPQSINSYLSKFHNSQSDCESFNVEQLSYWESVSSNPFLPYAMSQRVLSKQMMLIYNIAENTILQREQKESVESYFQVVTTEIWCVQADLRIDSMSPRCFLSLLIDYGYLSVECSYVYSKIKIPTTQIARIFIKIQKHLLAQRNLFINKIEVDIQKHLQFEQKAFANFQQQIQGFRQYNQKPYRAFMAGCYLFGVSNRNHTLSLQKKAGEGRLDALYLPKEGKSNTAIIYKYKVTEITFVNMIRQDQLFEDTMWQIYDKQYLTLVLNYRPIKKNIQFIILRALVFFDNEKQYYSKNQHRYSIQEAEIVNNFFAQYRILGKPSIMLGFGVKTFQQALHKIKNNQKLSPLVQRQSQRMKRCLGKPEPIKQYPIKLPSKSEDQIKKQKGQQGSNLAQGQSKIEASKQIRKEDNSRSKGKNDGRQKQTQILTALIYQNPLQFIDNTFESIQNVKVQPSHIKTSTLPTITQTKYTIRVKVQSGLDEKLNNQIEYFESTGVMFDHLRQALTDGIARAYRWMLSVPIWAISL